MEEVNYWQQMFYDLLEQMEYRIGSDDWLLEEFRQYAKELEEEEAK
jgi:hypothetical protein